MATPQCRGASGRFVMTPRAALVLECNIKSERKFEQYGGVRYRVRLYLRDPSVWGFCLNIINIMLIAKNKCKWHNCTHKRRRFHSQIQTQCNNITL